MRNESTKMDFIEPKMRLRSFRILFLKNIKGNTGLIQIEENLSKVYKSHTDKCFISIPITDMS